MGNHFLSAGHQSVIAGGTGVVLATPDNTTQIVAIVVQIVTLLLAFFNRKKVNN